MVHFLLQDRGEGDVLPGRKDEERIPEMGAAEIDGGTSESLVGNATVRRVNLKQGAGGRKPATPAQQFKQSEKSVARLSKMKLEDITDPEMRAREEAWRKMEQAFPKKDVRSRASFRSLLVTTLIHAVAGPLRRLTRAFLCALCFIPRWTSIAFLEDP